MKGTNDRVFNHATIVDALQEYLDKRIKPNVAVNSVRYDANASDGGKFVVTVQEVEAKL